MDCYLNILKEKQPKPEEIIDEEKLRFIVSTILIWDLFRIPQSNSLAFLKDENSRMFSEYYNKLFSKYFGGKNLFLSDIV